MDPDNIPGILSHELFYWYAFDALNADRQISMAVGYIPFSAIDAYARRYDLEGDDFDDFYFIINQLDSTFVRHHNQKNNN